ncbi:MAG: YitT family protein [Clostridia bacterium]|nr:YitT family protein [Clostridia bacterium]
MLEQENPSQRFEPQQTAVVNGKKEKDDFSPKTLAVDILICFIAALLVAASLFYFSNYNHFAPGGVTGFASIVGSLVADALDQDMTVWMSIFMIAFNAPIFLLVAIFVSKKTGIILIIYLSFQSLLLYLFQYLNSAYGLPYYGAFAESGKYYSPENNVVFAAIGVGVISGLGFSIMLRRFGASGGTYAISSLIKHFKPESNIAWVSFIMDASVVIFAMFAYQSGTNAVISTLLNIFIANMVVDYMLRGVRSGYKFEIVTDKPDELSLELMTKLGRGVTALRAEGMYTHKDHSLLICIVRNRQVGEFLKILKNYTATFTYSCKVNEVYGRFEVKKNLKHHIGTKKK